MELRIPTSAREELQSRAHTLEKAIARCDEDIERYEAEIAESRLERERLSNILDGYYEFLGG